jgi:HrpA-like RNA helicase
LKPLALKNPPTVPPKSNADREIEEKRESLPISSFRDEILEKIENNRTILVQGLKDST